MTARITLCTAIYESARPYLEAFTGGISRAAEHHEVSVLAVSDGLENAEASLAPLSRAVPLRLIEAPARATPAIVRARLFRAARESGSDVLVFTDADDVLMPDALGLHLSALAEADFSYGDQVLVGPDGEDLGTTLYETWDVPARTSQAGDLLDGNFVGFSAAALRQDTLNAALTAIPDHLIAVDWWFFTRLLIAGHSGARTMRPVVRYRQHAGNIAGPHPDKDPAAVLKRCEAARAHYAAFPDWPEAVRRRAGVERLISEIAAPTERAIALIDRVCEGAQRWYGDIARMALALDAQGGVTEVAQQAVSGSQ